MAQPGNFFLFALISFCFESEHPFFLKSGEPVSKSLLRYVQSLRCLCDAKSIPFQYFNNLKFKLGGLMNSSEFFHKSSRFDGDLWWTFFGQKPSDALQPAIPFSVEIQ